MEDRGKVNDISQLGQKTEKAEDGTLGTPVTLPCKERALSEGRTLPGGDSQEC